jgi:hypothetical protein
VQKKKGTVAGLRTIWFACIWCIWKARNMKVFQDKNVPGAAITEQSKILAWNWLRVKSRCFNYDISQWITNPVTCLENVK